MGRRKKMMIWDSASSIKLNISLAFCWLRQGGIGIVFPEKKQRPRPVLMVSCCSFWCLGLRSVFPEEKERHQMAQWSTRKRESLSIAITISRHVWRIAMETQTA